MTLGLIILGAGVLAMSGPDGQDFKNTKIPSWAVREGSSAGFVYELVVAPEGRVTSCEVIGHLGNERLASEMCENLVGLRTDPARGPDGNPVYARYRNWMTAIVDDSRDDVEQIRTMRMRPDMELQVASLQDAVPVDVELELFVDETGKVAVCEQADDSDADPALGEAACDQLRTLTSQPFKNPSGTAVPYITTMVVRFAQS